MRHVEAIMPLKTGRPIDRRAPAPAPVATTSGKTPKMKAKEVKLVPITSTNGQVGGFLRTEVAPMLRPYQRVLYLVLQRLVAGPLHWTRLAITEDQVEQRDLPASAIGLRWFLSRYWRANRSFPLILKGETVI
jgi:hypothetical protein